MNLTEEDRKNINANDDARKMRNKKNIDLAETCPEFQINLNVIPILYLDTYGPDMFTGDNKVQDYSGYYIQIPANIKLIKNIQIYGIDSFVGEFGGWCGIFVGISILSLFSKIFKIPINYIISKSEDHTISALKVFGILCVGSIFVIAAFFVTKYLEYPKATELTVEPLEHDFIYTICSSHHLDGELANYTDFIKIEDGRAIL